MKKKKPTGKKSKKASDFGNPELRNHYQTVIETSGSGVGQHRLRVVDGCELDRLLYGNLITPDQHNAGIRLGGDVSRAGCKTNWLAAMNSTGKGGVSGGRFLFAAKRISKAMASVQKECDRVTARLMMSVACDEVTINGPAQLTRLVIGLDALSEHYSSQSFVPTTLR
tara:strand:- start:223 stop:726 length:504 start_codon:yes stop_codon:yes gene_type:complete